LPSIRWWMGRWAFPRYNVRQSTPPYRPRTYRQPAFTNACHRQAKLEVRPERKFLSHEQQNRSRSKN